MVIEILKWIGRILLILLILVFYLLFVPFHLEGNFSGETGSEEDTGSEKEGSLSASFRARSFLSFLWAEGVYENGEFTWGVFLFWKLVRILPGKKKKKKGSSSPERKKEKKKKTAGEIFALLKKLLREEERSGIRHILSEVISLLKKMNFHFRNTEIAFAFDTPDKTGKALGILAQIPAVYEPEFHLEPDFTAKKGFFRGHGSLRGHIILIDILTAAIRLFSDRNVRKLLNTTGGGRHVRRKK